MATTICIQLKNILQKQQKDNILINSAVKKFDRLLDYFTQLPLFTSLVGDTKQSSPLAFSAIRIIP